MNKFRYSWTDRQPWLVLPFPEEEYENRIKRIRNAMRRRDIDCLLVYGSKANPGDVRYISNVWSPPVGASVIVLPCDSDPVFVTDSLFHTEYGVWDTWIKDIRADKSPRVIEESITHHVQDILSERELGHAVVGIVGERAMSVSFCEALRGTADSTQWVFASDLLLEIRMRKSALEIEIMRKAINAAVAGLKVVMDEAQPGMTERQLVGRVDSAILQAGAEMLSKATALVAGPRGGMKHVFPSDRAFQLGDMLCVDVGADIAGYQSDVARNYVIGKPTHEQREMLEISLEMSKACIAKMKPGIKVGQIVDEARNVARRAGWDAYFTPFAFGHFIGTSFCELALLPGSDFVFESGMTCALEPTLVKPGFGSAVAEDIVLITEKGAERLTDFPQRTW